MKKCAKCGIEKPRTEFYKHHTVDGLRGDCKPCNVIAVRDRRLLRIYGLTFESFSSMIKDQNGGCAICGTKLDIGKNTHVDHSHVTGKVRAILCQNCNTALGGFKDSIDILKSAQAYLEKYKQKTGLKTTGFLHQYMYD